MIMCDLSTLLFQSKFKHLSKTTCRYYISIIICLFSTNSLEDNTYVYLSTCR